MDFGGQMKLRNILLILAFLSLVSLVSISAGGYLYYVSLKKSSLDRAHQEAMIRTQLIADHIDSFLSERQKTIKAFAGLKELHQALADKEKSNILEANLILDHFRQALNVDVCYLMDEQGNTVASSNRNAPDSFVGKNYAFRPYFQGAKQGNPTIYMALGATSGKRGVYFSHPVYGKLNELPSGVVVVKDSNQASEKEIKRVYEGVMLFTDPHGVIFVSSRERWLFHILWSLSPDESTKVVKTRQFGNEPLIWTGLERESETRAVDKSGVEYHIHQSEIKNYPGWKVVYLLDSRAVANRTAGPLFKTAGLIILISCLLVGVTVFFLYKEAANVIVVRQKAEGALRESEEKVKAILETIPDPVVMYDVQGHPKYLNPAFVEIFGWTLGELQGKQIPFVPEDHKDVTSAKIKTLFDFGKPVRVESKRVTREGLVLDVLISAALTKDTEGKYTGVVVSLTDITERKNLEEERIKLIHELEKISTTDPLTGAYNRRYFNEAARKLFKLSVRYKRSLSAVMLDIDYFKNVNDTYGHDIGDEVLKKLAQTCQKLMREADLSARYGGEEFCFLFPETNSSEAFIIAERLRATIANLEMDANDRKFSITASFGISECNHDEDSLAGLIKRSDEALYEAKRKGRNCVVTKNKQHPHML